MRVLKIKREVVDIDEKTIIGITFQGYDVKDPSKRFRKISNSFSIPATSKNLGVFGNSESSQWVYSFNKSSAYTLNSCSYAVDNVYFLEDATVAVNKIDSRIHLTLSESTTFWDRAKEISWQTVQKDYFVFLDIPAVNPFGSSGWFKGTYTEFMALYSNTNDLCFAYIIGDNYNDEEDPETLTKLQDGVAFQKINGSHWCANVKSLFNFFEAEYDVDFLTRQDGVNANVWDDEYIKSVFVPTRNIGAATNGTWFGFDFDENPEFVGLNNINQCEGKTLFDFIQSFLQHFNIIVDDFDGDLPAKSYRLTRFNDLEEKAEVVDFSGNLSGVPTYKPTFQNLAQTNTIQFSDRYENGTKESGQIKLSCENETLKPIANLFTINAYFPSFLDNNGTLALDYSAKESFKNFTFLTSTGLTPEDIEVVMYKSAGGWRHSTSLKLKTAEVVDVEGEYYFYEKMIEYPRFYEVSKWLNSLEIQNVEYFKLYYVKELGGSFFLNKISGFNPDKSNKPVKLELIKVSDKVPKYTEPRKFWSDGLDNIFSDGLNNKFF